MMVFRNFFFNRKFLFLLINITSILLILVLVFSIFLSINPNHATRFLDRFFITDFKIEYAGITSNGPILHPNIKFKDFKLLKENELIGKTDNLEVSISIIESLLFRKPIIHNIVINNGIIYPLEVEDASLEFLKINSNISFNKDNLINGHIHFIQNNITGALFLSADKEVQRYFINLPDNDWLYFLSLGLDNNFKKIKFSI